MVWQERLRAMGEVLAATVPENKRGRVQDCYGLGGRCLMASEAATA